MPTLKHQIPRADETDPARAFRADRTVGRIRRLPGAIKQHYDDCQRKRDAARARFSRAVDDMIRAHQQLWESEAAGIRPALTDVNRVRLTEQAVRGALEILRVATLKWQRIQWRVEEANHE